MAKVVSDEEKAIVGGKLGNTVADDVVRQHLHPSIATVGVAGGAKYVCCV